MIEVLRYVSGSGEDVIGNWLIKLRDERTQAKITTRFLRLTAGNFGDCKSLGGGIGELRIDWGPGYRIYYAMLSRTRVLLLCGGDKRSQNADIRRARDYWKDYKRTSEDT